jgi:hypothetical protein
MPALSCPLQHKKALIALETTLMLKHNTENIIYSKAMHTETSNDYLLAVSYLISDSLQIIIIFVHCCKKF